jgi:SHS2 domain-containing protein
MLGRGTKNETSINVMTSTTPDYTLIDHTADLGIMIRGTDLENLFEGAGRALTQLMVEGVVLGKTTSRKISLSGEDLADLMVRWLGEILYLFEGENLVATRIHITSISPSRLEATLETVPFDPEIHEILNEIKAVTYHQIEVADKGDQWEARVIFDI